MCWLSRLGSVGVGGRSFSSFFFFFNDTATTEIYTLSLHDALPICDAVLPAIDEALRIGREGHLPVEIWHIKVAGKRSEEHTSELQSQSNLVCRLLLEKKKKTTESQTVSIVHLP